MMQSLLSKLPPPSASAASQRETVARTDTVENEQRPSEDSASTALALQRVGDGAVVALPRESSQLASITEAQAGYERSRERDVTEDALALPHAAEVGSTNQRTEHALQRAMERKRTGALSSVVDGGGSGFGSSAPEYVQYSAKPGTPGFVPGVSDRRVVQINSVQADPMEPPRFRHRRAPSCQPGPEEPVLHSPPQKLTKQDLKQWDVPPSISQWKNQGGFAIALDKRLAANSKNVSHTMVGNHEQVSSRFSELAESLLKAEQTARDDIEQRARIQREMESRERERKELELRELAALARAHRGVVSGGADSFVSAGAPLGARVTGGFPTVAREPTQGVKESNRTTPGMRESGGAGMSELAFDQRLFDRAPAGLDSGHGAEDSYSMYDKPLFAAGGSSVLYRPLVGARDGAAAHVSSFRSDSIFRGGGSSRGGEGNGMPRSAHSPDESLEPRQEREVPGHSYKPVEFERDPGGLASGGPAQAGRDSGSTLARNERVDSGRQARDSARVSAEDAAGASRGVVGGDEQAMNAFISDVRGARVDAALAARRKSAMIAPGSTALHERDAKKMRRNDYATDFRSRFQSSHER
ncbi:SNW/SKI-interacting protein [Porphyridium purpureum]|uniref:SNW/SKI-interacting protein n=1 Tax=Porphyridium purpureum TaxID=35688 RepID=A0A5J4YLV9_PORPP|nr:SNW/SKI-interacting protein [Porphyridium purpureum]|eukprot:POR0968..scf295_9